MHTDNNLLNNLKEKRELNGVTIEDLREYGYCHFLEEFYLDEVKTTIKIEVYELDGKTYLLRCVNNECLTFRDITAINK